MDSMSGKHMVLSLEAKTSILEPISKGNKRDATALFGTLQRSLSTVWNSKDSVVNSLKKGTSDQWKRLRAATYEDVDKAAFKWLTSNWAQDIPISGTALQQKVKDFVRSPGTCASD